MDGNNEDVDVDNAKEEDEEEAGAVVAAEAFGGFKRGSRPFPSGTP